jgi:hypothetical protein
MAGHARQEASSRWSRTRRGEGPDPATDPSADDAQEDTDADADADDADDADDVDDANEDTDADATRGFDGDPTTTDFMAGFLP